MKQQYSKQAFSETIGTSFRDFLERACTIYSPRVFVRDSNGCGSGMAGGQQGRKKRISFQWRARSDRELVNGYFLENQDRAIS